MLSALSHSDHQDHWAVDMGLRSWLGSWYCFFPRADFRRQESQLTLFQLRSEGQPMPVLALSNQLGLDFCHLRCGGSPLLIMLALLAACHPCYTAFLPEVHSYEFFNFFFYLTHLYWVLDMPLKIHTYCWPLKLLFFIKTFIYLFMFYFLDNLSFKWHEVQNWIERSWKYVCLIQFFASVKLWSLFFAQVFRES